MKPPRELKLERKRAAWRKWYAANTKKAQAQLYKWRAENPEKVKKIARKRHLKALYGLTLDEYAHLVEIQNARCAICQKVTKLCVDHDHATNRVRGLLCNLCNIALGHFDTHDILTSAITYLQEG